ncbi:MAG: prepilin-type N-terminal cleavage/methylation domain-containing protein [Ruthenibacterium sp.]
MERMKNSNRSKAKGFTLVELLIVIIIIGILAGMMMLSTGAATDKAEATKVVSNLRTIKSAVIMYYADYNKWPVDADNDMVRLSKATPSSLDKYIDNIPEGYYVRITDRIYVACDGSEAVPAFTDTTGAGKALKNISQQPDSPIWVTGSGNDFDVAMDIQK